MDKPGRSVSSEKSLEETLCQCVEEWTWKKISCSPGAATEPAGMRFALESPYRGNEASQKLRLLKCSAPRVSNEKMGPREGAIGKQRQQRHSSKGIVKVYPADPSNFKALVYKHTCKLPPSPPPDVPAQPSSPLTPHSITSVSSAGGLISQPSSPATPHSVQSSSPSPISSPHQGPGFSVNPFSPVFKVCTEHHPYRNPHLNVPHSLPSLRNDYQPTYVPQSSSTPSLEISTKVNNASTDKVRPHCKSPTKYAKALSFNSLKRFLLDDEAVCGETCGGGGIGSMM